MWSNIPSMPRQEGQVHLEYRFMTGRYRKHDPKGLVPKHAEQVVLTWPYAHEKWEEELFTENSQDWKEVEKRRANPNVTIFSSLPIEEKIKMVNLGVSSRKGTSKGKQGGEEDLITEKEQQALQGRTRKNPKGEI
jgi:hypothetical protein